MEIFFVDAAWGCLGDLVFGAAVGANEAIGAGCEDEIGAAIFAGELALGGRDGGCLFHISGSPSGDIV